MIDFLLGYNEKSAKNFEVNDSFLMTVKTEKRVALQLSPATTTSISISPLVLSSQLKHELFMFLKLSSP